MALSSFLYNRHNCCVDLNFYDVPEIPEDKFKLIPMYLILVKFSDTVKEYFRPEDDTVN